MPKIIQPLLLIPTTLIVGLYAYLGTFAQLMADDFCSIYYAERLGILRSVWYWYISWHGGFSASFADGLLGLFGRSGIGFVMPLTVAIWTLALAWSAASIFKSMGLRWQGPVGIVFSLLVLFGTLIISPTTSASLIWWGGLRGYAPPLIIMPVYIAVYMLFRSRGWQGVARYVWCVFSFGIMFVCGGFSEPFTPLQIIVLFLLLAVEWYISRDLVGSQNMQFLYAGILGGVMALAIMVLAPGNASRQEYFPAPPPPLEIVAIGLQSYLWFLSRVVLNLQKIMTMISVFGGGMLLGTFFLDSKHFNVRNLAGSLLFGLVFAYCCFLPAAYGQSAMPSDTSLITPVYILMIALASAGIVSGGMLGKALQPFSLRYTLLLLLLVFVSLGYATARETQQIIAEIDRAGIYAANWEIRDQQIKQARQDGLGEVFVPAITRWITEEPIDNPRFFVNKCMSMYYGINILSSPKANE